MQKKTIAVIEDDQPISNLLYESLTHEGYEVLRAYSGTEALYLLEHISRDTPDCSEGSLKQHISNLRGKLREADSHDYIEAVWGIGFRLTLRES